MIRTYVSPCTKAALPITPQACRCAASISADRSEASGRSGHLGGSARMGEVSGVGTHGARPMVGGPGRQSGSSIRVRFVPHLHHGRAHGAAYCGRLGPMDAGPDRPYARGSSHRHHGRPHGAAYRGVLDPWTPVRIVHTRPVRPHLHHGRAHGAAYRGELAGDAVATGTTRREGLPEHPCQGARPPLRWRALD